jgi:DNA-binding CsgD family transcriptional regulator
MDSDADPRDRSDLIREPGMAQQPDAVPEATGPDASRVEAERRRAGRRRSDRYGPSSAAVAGAAALATLDKLSRGVVLLDATGAVCFANQAAEAMAASQNGLRLWRGRLQFEAVDSYALFESYLSGGTGTAEGGGLVLRVGGSPRRDPYRVLVSPLGPRSARSHGYCVFIYEPSGGHRPVPVVVLQQLYGLTAAEARLANALFSGQSLVESASAGGIRLNTAKSVLKRIFTKCAVSSQSELVLLLSLGPRTL